ncbi:acetylornithine aminotransferase [Trichophyton rubrum]|uniref:acetylornithine transaminase n=1 Tax=Trichophyton rubrum TaxID=5551 RepID=A0A178EQM4_TRIRU|nr:acetylornithine aminotransferase [Trichophyton rubrum]
MASRAALRRVGGALQHGASPLSRRRRWASTASSPEVVDPFKSKPSSTVTRIEHDDLPGNLSKRSDRFVEGIMPFMVPTYARPTPVMARGSGCYLWDMENKQYLDFTAGIAVTSLGHSDPGLSQVLSEQALVSTTLTSGAMRTATQAFICNSGTEANEAALKFARKVGHSLDTTGAKHEIVSFQGSFHGRTFGALSATPNPKYQAPFAPMVPGFKYGKYNDIEQLPTLITDKTCGVIVEPIQGEGGVNVASAEFLTALRARCDQVGAVLIFDEIQCGLSRTGSLWAHAHPSLRPKNGSKPAHPDILTTAKALGNGFPIGATIISSDTVGKYIKVGDHGTTFGGSPLACAVGNHVLTRLANKDLQDSVNSRSQTLIKGLKRLQERYPDAVSEIRGRGLILGLQLTAPYVSKVSDILGSARDKGLLIISAGEGCIRFVPPLVINDAEIEVGLGILDEAMGEVVNKE